MADSFSVGIDPRALDEVSEAAGWYEEQRQGLGGQFAQAFDAVVEKLSVRPLAYPPLRSVPSLHRTHLDQFPYSVIYRVDLAAHEVQIVACWHQRRDPASLVRRLRGGPLTLG